MLPRQDIQFPGVQYMPSKSYEENTYEVKRSLNIGGPECTTKLRKVWE